MSRKAEPNALAEDFAQHWQVVVIGAGVAGGLAALLSARAGLKTLLVDKQKFPRHKTCGCCLNAAAVQSLKRAQLLDMVELLQPTHVQQVRFHVSGRSASVKIPGTLAVSRRQLDQQFVTATVAAGGDFVDGCVASVLPGTQPVRHIRLLPSGSETEAVSIGSHRKLFGRNSPLEVTADVVLACGGLGHPCLKLLPEITSDVAPGSRVGLGAVVSRTSADVHYPTDELQMAINSDGYVGTVATEGDQLNIAAAINPDALKHGQQPAEVLHNVYTDAGLTAPSELLNGHVHGTLPLTRTASSVSVHRVFILGDASGYVEPITGEGMAWAMQSAELVTPLVRQAVEGGWTEELQDQWSILHRTHITSHQKICRRLAGSLRQPWLLTPMLAACNLFPTAVGSIVNHINRSTVSGRH